MISTAFHDTFTKDAVRANVANATALRREGGANEVAETVAYLAFRKVRSNPTNSWRHDIVNVNDDLLERLAAAPVVPLVVPDDPETAIRTAKALVAGGLSVIEVVLRTSAAIECLAEVVRAVPGAIVGAGTVLVPSSLNGRLPKWFSPGPNSSYHRVFMRRLLNLQNQPGYRYFPVWRRLLKPRMPGIWVCAH